MVLAAALVAVILLRLVLLLIMILLREIVEPHLAPYCYWRALSILLLIGLW